MPSVLKAQSWTVTHIPKPPPQSQRSVRAHSSSRTATHRQTETSTMVRMLALASLFVVAIVSFSPAQATVPDPMTVVAKANNVAMDTSSQALDTVTDAAKRNTNDKSQIQKKV
ncbi:hypothetical protein PHYPSEUDO_010930 [Phytophthora pseudosyringae]|uniref:Uncharacterized protein n=1 Tax=Phytophthora pseudosyringae TaxID=221518 RepID=A0A8T1VEB5_9STRA|nr:hypothetical protein PHYPSEUDO_010930 [Phytophthora pseudosyringae]